MNDSNEPDYGTRKIKPEGIYQNVLYHVISLLYKALEDF